MRSKADGIEAGPLAWGSDRGSWPPSCAMAFIEWHATAGAVRASCRATADRFFRDAVGTPGVRLVMGCSCWWLGTAIGSAVCCQWGFNHAWGAGERRAGGVAQRCDHAALVA